MTNVWDKREKELKKRLYDLEAEAQLEEFQKCRQMHEAEVKKLKMALVQQSLTTREIIRKHQADLNSLFEEIENLIRKRHIFRPDSAVGHVWCNLHQSWIWISCYDIIKDLQELKSRKLGDKK